jgi:hypothetical protein
MEASYAVKWREPNGHTFLGRLELSANGLVLEGRNGGEAATRRTIAFAELRGFRIGRQPGERLDGQPTLVVDRPGGHFLIATSLIHAGVLPELVHRLSELRLAAQLTGIGPVL